MMHNKIRLLLQDGQMEDEATRMMVDVHLAACADCRAFAQMLGKLAGGDCSPHPGRKLNSAEIRTLRLQLNAAAAQPKRRTWLNVQTASLALGMASLFVISFLGWQMLKPVFQLGSETNGALIVTTTATATAQPSPEAMPVVELIATSAMSATLEPVPVVVESLIETAPTELPPTQATMALTPTSTVQPEAAATLTATARPTIIKTRTPLPIPVPSATLAQPSALPDLGASRIADTQRLFTEIATGSAESIAAFFAPTSAFATRSSGTQILLPEEIAQELMLMRQLKTVYTLSDCYSEPISDAQMSVRCGLSMQNDWRRGVGLTDSYQAMLWLTFHSNGDIVRFENSQIYEQREVERSELNRFAAWHRATFPAVEPINLSADITTQFTRSADYLALAKQWVDLGKP